MTMTCVHPALVGPLAAFQAGRFTTEAICPEKMAAGTDGDRLVHDNMTGEATSWTVNFASGMKRR
jgi:hypothetical protein